MSRRSVVLALTAVAALVRFATLDAQSLWYDEALTYDLVNSSFGGMIDGALDHEAQPPLYFVLAWLWVHVFGDGEVGLRSLSALLGTLTVPVAYEAARIAGGRRVALAAGAFTALSPALVWYSQEARAYALMIFLCAVSLLFFLRSLDGARRRDLVGWVVGSALAFAAHYFAIFLVLPMAAWLLLRGPGPRRMLPYLAGLAAGLLAMAPLLLYQQQHSGVDWIGEIPRWPRVRDVVFLFVAGPNGVARLTDHRDEVFAVGLGGFALALATALAWTRGVVRGRVALMAGLAAAAMLVPLLVALFGPDYILDRNLLPAWIPLAIVVAAGLCAPRLRWAGPALAAVVCLGFAACVYAAATNPERQRDDWRSVGERIGASTEDRLVVVAPYWHMRTLRVYQPGLKRTGASLTVRRIVTVELEAFVPFGDLVTAPAPPPPFRETFYARIQNFTVREYTAPRPVAVPTAALRSPGVNRAVPFVLPGR